MALPIPVTPVIPAPQFGIYARNLYDMASTVDYCCVLCSMPVYADDTAMVRLALTEDLSGLIAVSARPMTRVHVVAHGQCGAHIPDEYTY